jgi:hypothetical protein
MEFLKLVFSETTLKGLAAFAFVAMLLSVRYWVEFYNQFSLDILSLALPVDLLGLSVSRLPVAISALLVGAGPLAAVFLIVWSDKHNNSTSLGCVALLGLVSIAVVPGLGMSWAARTDAQLVRTAKQPGWWARLMLDPKPPMDAAIDTRDGAQLERTRWIGATTTYLFLLRPDSTHRMVRREDVRGITFWTVPLR